MEKSIPDWAKRHMEQSAEWANQTLQDYDIELHSRGGNMSARIGKRFVPITHTSVDLHTENTPYNRVGNQHIRHALYFHIPHEMGTHSYVGIDADENNTQSYEMGHYAAPITMPNEFRYIKKASGSHLGSQFAEHLDEHLRKVNENMENFGRSLTVADQEKMKRYVSASNRAGRSEDEANVGLWSDLGNIQTFAGAPVRGGRIVSSSREFKDPTSYDWED